MNVFKRTPTTRMLFFMASDAVLIGASVLSAFFIRFEGNIPVQYLPAIAKMAVLAVAIIIPTFYLQRLYFFSWSYVSVNEAIALAKASAIAFALLSAALYALKYFSEITDFPRSTIFISFCLVFIACGALRFSKKLYLHVVGLQRMSEKNRTLIVGAGDAGEQILRHMLSSPASPYFPVGFADNNRIKQGVKIHGIKVLGKIEDIPALAKEHDVRQLIIALPSDSNRLIKEAVRLGRAAGLRKIKIAPPLAEVMKGDAALKNLKDIDVEDLLGRDSVHLDTGRIEQLIKGNVVLITGAAGSIGSELSRQAARFHPSLLVLLDQDETGIFNISKEIREKFPKVAMRPIVADVTDQGRINAVFKECAPRIVFHAAAYKHVPLMEQNLSEAVKNNIFGTEILARASIAHGVEKFIFISTDKAINPTSVMGSTKRIGEMICQSLSAPGKTTFISVRFGNVLNSRGSVIPIFKEQIRRGGPVEVTDPEMKRYFMLTREACLLVMEAGAIGQASQVLVLDMGSPIKILDLAREMIRLSGFEPDKDIAIVFTGVRPGEKLFEEMMTAEEGTGATQHDKIFVAKLAAVDAGELEESLARLVRAVADMETDRIKEVFKRLIPSYNAAEA